MADDVNVKEIDLIKAYSDKIGELKDWSLVGTGAICIQAERIKADLEKQLHELECIQCDAEIKSRHLIEKYNTVIDDAGEQARYIIGNSDLDTKRIVGNINIRMEEIKDKIRRLQTLLDNASQHTKNYYLQITNMVDSCQNKLGLQVQALEEYKNQHM